jgi:hypothetical protein
MARQCPKCGRAPFANDPMYHVAVDNSPAHVVFVGAGFEIGRVYPVCWDCFREVQPNLPPRPPAPPRRNSGNIFQPIPDFDAWLCGVCNQYAREDDPAIQWQRCKIRLTVPDILSMLPKDQPLPADEAAVIRAWSNRKPGDKSPSDKEIGDLLERRAGVRPGAACCCQACWEKWGPIVLRRWQREGALHPRIDFSQVAELV